MLAGVILFLAGLFVVAAGWKLIVFLSSGSLIAYGVVTKRHGSAVAIHNKIQNQAVPKLSDPLVDAFEGHEHVHQSSESDSGMLELKNLVDSETEIESDEHDPSTETNAMMQAERIPQERSIDFQLSDFFDSEPEGTKEQGPRAEFNDLVKKVLTVIKEVNFAHTVALFWINRDKNQLVLENFVSESEFFASHRRRELGVDLVSQVALGGKPQILTNVNAASVQETLPYYEGAEAVKTFVGVPIFYSHATMKPQEAVAVLTVDCRGEDAYGPETLALLGNFTKLISSLIRSYTDKYDLLLDSEMLLSISRFREQMRMEFSAHNLARSLAEETAKLIAWDYVSVVLYDDARASWSVQFTLNRMNDPYVSLTSEIDVANSIVGQVIQSCNARVVERIATLGRPRFYPAERCESSGSLLVVPLNSISRCYGALVVESKDVSTYAENDVKLIRKLTGTASWALEILGLNDVAANFVATDEITGVASQKYFLMRLQEEVQRANDFLATVTVVLIGVDGVSDLTSRYGSDGVDAVMQSVGRVVKSAVRPYDVIGRYDTTTFGVILVQSSANEAALWSEKVRKNVASNIIIANEKTFSVTVSIGIANSNGTTRDVEILEHAGRVLNKAIESNGNIVRVY
jgi:diguanylate cyclase (GGDEF)-like protein